MRPRRGRLSSASRRMFRTARVSGAAPIRRSMSLYAQNLWMQSPYVIVKADGDPSRLVPAIRRGSEGHRCEPASPGSGDDERAAEDVDDRTAAAEPPLRAHRGPRASAGRDWHLRRHGVSREPAPPRDSDPPRARRPRERAWSAASWPHCSPARRLWHRRSACIGALLMSHSLATLLFQRRPTRSRLAHHVAALLATAALVACAVPAARTARIDPASVLRDE